MKELSVLFGLHTTDIEEAKKWIEEATGVEAKGFFSDYVDDYYIFNPFGSGEEIELCSGVSEDEDGKYPTEQDFPSWALIARLSKSKQGSRFLKALEARPDRFEKLRTKIFED